MLKDQQFKQVISFEFLISLKNIDIWTSSQTLQFQSLHMKIAVVLVLMMALWQCSSQDIDFGGMSQKELKDLQQVLSFKKARAQPQDQNGFNSGFLNQLLNQEEQSSDYNKPDNKENKLSDMIKEIPYEVLLPRRRNSPLDVLGNLFKQKNKQSLQDRQIESESQADPLGQLNKLIRKKSNKGKNLFWENPDFKENQMQIPFMKIFGPKSKVNRDLNIDQNLIQKLLVDAMPNLKGGKILMLSSVPYQKGIYLHIEYETEKNQFYAIKAKYRHTKNQLQIISLSEVNIPKNEEQTSSENYQAEDKKEEPRVQEKQNIQNKQSKLIQTKQQPKEDIKLENKEVEKEETKNQAKAQQAKTQAKQVAHEEVKQNEEVNQEKQKKEEGKEEVKENIQEEKKEVKQEQSKQEQQEKDQNIKQEEKQVEAEEIPNPTQKQNKDAQEKLTKEEEPSQDIENIEKEIQSANEQVQQKQEGNKSQQIKQEKNKQQKQSSNLTKEDGNEDNVQQASKPKDSKKTNAIQSN